MEERQRLLAEIARPAPRLLVSKPVIGKGRRLFELAKKRGLEGIVGKRRDSPYVERRSRDWVKIKAVNEQEAVIIGWTDPKGSRQGFGALLMGLYDDGTLEYVGKVGTGFDRNTIADLSRRLRPIASTTAPVSNASEPHVHWIKPRLVAEIRFEEWTRGGMMRQPVFLGLREDKRPRDCVRERPTSR